MTMFEKLIEARDKSLFHAQKSTDLDLTIFYKNAANCYEAQALNMTLEEASIPYVGTSNN